MIPGIQNIFRLVAPQTFVGVAPVTITGFSFALVAGQRYFLELCGVAIAQAANGLTISPLAAGGLVLANEVGMISFGFAAGAVSTDQFDTSQAFNTAGGAGLLSLNAVIGFDCTTSGNLVFQAQQDAAGGGTTEITQLLARLTVCN